MSKTDENLPALVANDEKLVKKIDFFGITADNIEEYKTNYKGLTIAGIDDKDGYKAVKEGLATMVSVRNKLDKHRLMINKFVNDEAKRIQGELTPIEEALNKTKGDADKLIAAEAEKKEREAIAKFNERTGKLIDAGYKYDGMIYQLGTSVQTPESIKNMADEVFERIHTAALSQADQVAKDKAAQDKIEQDLAAEREALNKQKADLNLQEELLNKKAELMRRQAAGEIASFECSIVDGKVMSTTKYPESQHKPIVSTAHTSSAATVKTTETTNVAEEEDKEREFYNDGFEYCRKLVVEIISSPDKITRQILIDKVNALKP